MPVTRSAREAASRDANAVNPKKRPVVGYESRGRRPVCRRWTSPTSWASSTTPSYPRSKTALVGFRLKVWPSGRGHLVFGLSSLLALLGYYDPALFHVLFKDGKE